MPQFTNVVYLNKSSNELLDWFNHTRMIRRYHITVTGGARWLGGRALDLRMNGRRFEAHRRHCIVSLSKSLHPLLSTVHPWKTGNSPEMTKFVDWGIKHK